MVHLLMLVGSLAGAIGLRWAWRRQAGQSWQARWNATLIAFLVPPLLLLSTAIALLWMGPVCHMAGITIDGGAGYLPHGLAGAYCGLLLGLAGKLGLDAVRSHGRLRQYGTIALPIAARTLAQPTARLIPVAVPLIAQIGLWRPQLVVSQGLLAQLDRPHLAAVLHHEAAHRHYGDTLWFAAWGWLRRGSGWLPQTSALWRELLLLRELRADRWAARHSDPLLLAEALYTVVSAPRSLGLSVGFNETLVHDRLGERVDALLANDPTPTIAGETSPIALGLWLGLALLPLMTIVLHQ
jgi:Zn-dependent protease with chaperone function